jgi:hypothetical protein
MKIKIFAWSLVISVSLLIVAVVSDIICGLARRVYNSSSDHDAKGAARNPSDHLSHGRPLAALSIPCGGHRSSIPDPYPPPLSSRNGVFSALCRAGRTLPRRCVPRGAPFGRRAEWPTFLAVLRCFWSPQSSHRVSPISHAAALQNAPAIPLESADTREGDHHRARRRHGCDSGSNLSRPFR